MNQNSETFAVHLASIMKIMLIHPAKKVSIRALQVDRALTEVSAKYFDYINIFSSDLAMELFENTGMNEHAIELINRKQPPYGLIYALSPLN